MIDDKGGVTNPNKSDDRKISFCFRKWENLKCIE